ncbi:MAG: diaminopimelate decarboxylase [Chitinophagia bacterium]|nr:diaminopimelate decarboxylase [Chitinophagia bacterium]
MFQPLPDSLLCSLADEYATPLYVYDGNMIASQYQQLLQAFSQGKTRFFYACKALTNQNILKLVKQMGCGIDCSSINEVYLALRAGFIPNNILYTSNGIDFSEIVAAAELGIHINIDSLSNLEKFGSKFGHSYPVGIRLRPNIMAGGNLKISTGHEKSKFGIPIEDIHLVTDLVAKYNLHITSLHVHTGSEIKDVGIFVQVARILISIIPLFPELICMDMGGGFKVPYRDDENGTDLIELGIKTKEIQDEIFSKLGRNLEVWFEPGKFLVSECGYLITRVNVLKQSGSITFAGVDSGFNHLIRPMFYDAFHRIKNISNPQGPKKLYTITGNICETDQFAENRPIAEIREGDYLVFYNAGAYGYEMASTYNARFRPAQVLLENNTHRLISRRDTLDDLLRLQIL